ncbi:MAG: sensor histidine kinase [Acidithiobacillus sp.]
MDWQRFLETVARLVAVALESAIQFAKSRDAEVQLQVEQLHNALLGAVSHDLRTPLTSVVGAASTLQHAADLTDDERDKLIANILSESRKMSRMVGRILDMARLQSATMEIKKEWFPLEDLVAAATQRVEVLLRDHPLTANIAKDFPLLHVDGHLIEELLVNLLENAAKYTPSGAPIEIEGWDGQDGLNIRVIDHGVGVPPGREEEIFRRFSRVKPPTGEGGSGLGLAICDAIARLHGGKIRVSNRVMSRGAVFTLTLPKEAPPPNPPEEPKA